ncbi:MAG TPA: protease complex subunit PrcB family protein [Planctomycetes bacterium]|nr:protease complex subunit PrcB family protein [Planctomycetota bacterium]
MFSPRILSAACCALILSFMAGCNCCDSCDTCPSTTELAFESLSQGATSGVEDTHIVLARNPSEWNALWIAVNSASLSAKAAPEVDFSKEMVIGVFLGQRPTAGFGVMVLGCTIEKGMLSVQVRESKPPTGQAQATMVTRPYQLVKLAKTEGTPVLDWQ